MVTVILDSQAGSCGKGKFIGYYAKKHDIGVAIDNFMSNAGHTYEDDELGRVMTQQLPTSIVNPNTSLVIGPESAITPDILFDEMFRYSKIIGDRKVIINPNAVVIKQKHRNTEAKILRSGSTFKGCGAARADKVMRQAELFGSWWERFKAGEITTEEMGGKGSDRYSKYVVQYLEDHIIVMDTMQYVNDAIDNGEHILVEGSQGCDLDINYGLPYPNTTSRQCHAGQLTADCGISPMLVDEVIMIMRPYPIRISNTTNLKDDKGQTLVTSSGDYSGAEEITWDIVKERCGAPADMEFGEQTTVTKKTRRVFEMNWERLRYVTQLNRPTAIALNFAQYIDWGAYKCTDPDKLPQKVWDFINKVQEVTGVPVKLIGTGAGNDDIIDLM